MPEAAPRSAAAACRRSRRARRLAWGKALPYPIVIADRRNNRLIDVTPDSCLNDPDGFDLDVFRDWTAALRKP